MASDTASCNLSTFYVYTLYLLVKNVLVSIILCLKDIFFKVNL